LPSTIRDRATEGDALISVAQAAALLGVHPNTIRAWTEAGRLVAYRINARGDRRYRRADVERLLTEGGALPEEPAQAALEPSDPRLAVLARITQSTIGVTSAAAVCRVVVEALRTSVGIQRAAVYLQADREDGNLTLETHGGYQVAPAAQIAPDAKPRKGEVFLPLRAAGTDVGLLVLVADDGRQPDATFLDAVASTLAGHVRNVRILARARRELTRSRALRGVIQELSGQLELPTVLEEVVTRTRALFEADKAGLWLIGTGDQPFVEAAVHGLSDEFLAAVRSVRWESDAIGVRAVRDRRPFIVQHATTDPDAGPLGPMYTLEQVDTVCLVPLIANDEAVGVLGLYHSGTHAWPSEEVALAQAFANQAAVAISNARLYRSVADQAARMRSIQDLSARLNRLTDVTAIAEAIVAEANGLAEYHDIRIYRVDWESRLCEPIAFTDYLIGEGDSRDRLRVTIGPGSFTGMVAESAEPMLINDALADDRGLTIEGTDDIDESMLVVPMVYEERSVGVIALSKLGLNQFSTDDLQTMTIFAGYAAQAIANATAYERITTQSAELARQLDSQRRLLAINEQLLSTLDPSQVLESIADGLRSVVAYDNLSIYRVDHEREQLVPVLARDRFAAEVMNHIVAFGRGLMGWVVAHGEAALVNDALADPRAIQIPGTTPDPEAIVIVPLVAGGAVIGTLNVGRIGTEEIYFTQTDFELVKLFAAQASIALRNAEVHHQVTLRADTDALTGLGNHGAFQRRLDELVAARVADPGAAPLTLLMMDLDNFKPYNDRLGHPAGDALLRAIGEAIRSTARSDDQAYRYGGDEFAMVLPDVDVADAAVVADRIRRAVAALTAKDRDPVTITIGVSAYPDGASDKNELIQAADTALYYGKQSGGDRVVAVHDVPVEMRSLRGTLDQLARAALQHVDDSRSVEQLVGRAAQASADRAEDATRETMLAIARSLDAAGDGVARLRAERVGRLAAQVATQLGRTASDVDAIELAARFHALQLVTPGELGAVASLHRVNELMRCARRGDRSLSRIPPDAQIVVLADAFDALTDGATDEPLTVADALEALRTDGRGFRIDQLEALAAALQHAPLRHDRRRRARRTAARQPAEGAA
jgi:diguanylate cyclase (GGDEF)-like protein/excisionase family DNA binding protein